MFSDEACEALKAGKCLELRYSGFTRVVEVHTVGTATAGYRAMLVWQTRGGSVRNEPVGWKFLNTDEANGAVMLEEESLAPRPGYKSGDPRFQNIRCQL